MGVQLNNIKDLNSFVENSRQELLKRTNDDYLFKYFQISKCCESLEDIEYHYLIVKYLGDADCYLVDFLNKKMSGELEPEYKRRRLFQKLDRLEYKWQCCDDWQEEDGCCDWKSIQW